jgi:hypothetical protein
MVRLAPLRAPPVVGVHDRFTVQSSVGRRIPLHVPPGAMETPWPVTLVPVMVIDPRRTLRTVTAVDIDCPTCTDANAVPSRKLMRGLTMKALKSVPETTCTGEFCASMPVKVTAVGVVLSEFDPLPSAPEPP